MFRKKKKSTTRKSITVAIIALIAVSGSLYAATGGGFIFGRTEAKGLVGHWTLTSTDEKVGAQLVTDGDMETSGVGSWDSYWSPTTKAKNTTSPINDTQDLHIITDRDGYEGVVQSFATLTSGKRYKVSFHYRVVSGTATVVSGYAGLEDYILNSGTATTETAVTGYFTATTSDVYRVWLVASTASEFYIDDLYIVEIQAADATPYANDGTVYGATYTTDRNGQSNLAMSFTTDDYIDITSVVSDISDDTEGSISIWFTYPTQAASNRIFSVTDSGDALSMLDIYGATSGKVLFAIFENSSGVLYFSTDNTFDDGEWHHAVVTVDSSGNNTYVDGVHQDVTYINGSSSTQAWLNSINDLDSASIGRRKVSGTGSLYFTGDIADVRIYNYALSTTEVSQLYGGYKGSKLKVDLQDGLIGHWPLDTESAKSDTLAADATPYGNDGTMTSMTVSGNATTDQQGQSGRAMSFDGGADYIEVDDADELDIDRTDAKTISFWVKRTGSTGADQYILEKQSYGGSFTRIGWQVDIRSTYTLHFILRNDSSSQVLQVTSTDAVSTQDVWEYYVITLDGTGTAAGLNMYKNGASISFTTNTNTLTSASTINSEKMEIGSYNLESRGGYFLGSLADVRLYNRVLSTDEISRLYSAYRPKATYGSLEKGLVGHWSLKKKDEQNFSYATFDGADNISMGDISSADFGTGNFTICAWADNTDNASEAIIVSKSTDTGPAGYYLRTDSDSMNFNIRNETNPGNAYLYLSGQSFSGWHHFCGQRDSSSSAKIYVDGLLTSPSEVTTGIGWAVDVSSAATFYVGHKTAAWHGGNDFTGPITDVRIYNTALSATDIATLAKGENINAPVVPSGLVGWWTMNDFDDKSGQGNDGTNSGSSLTYSVMGDMTPYGNDGTVYGATMSTASTTFDGVDDYISVDVSSTSPLNWERTDTFSIAFWAKILDGGADYPHALMGRTDGNLVGTQQGFQMYTTSGMPYFSLISSWSANRVYRAASTAIDDDTWHHVAFTYDGSSANSGLHAYVDGVLSDGATAGSGLSGSTKSTNPMTIGRQANNQWNYLLGSLSGVRIYNRVLSSDEVSALYYKGH